MKNIGFLLTLLLITSCKFETQKTNETHETQVPQEKPFTPRSIDAGNPIFNWTCVPGEKIGLILKNFNEKDIIKAYGKENVSRQEIGLGEGEMTTATILFPNTTNELQIIWKHGQAFKTIEKIQVEHLEAPWATSQGIGIGTTLDELVKINGKDFQFAGFEWDYSGYTNDWQGGNISKNLAVFLEPTKPEVTYPELLGDDLFSSNLPKAKEADLKVRAMVFLFN